jgi:hypothetical protein
MFVHIDPDSKLAKVILVVGVLPGATVLLWLQLGDLFSSYRSTNWPTIPGTITESRIEHGNVHGIPTSHAHLRYRYVVNGQQLENDTIAFGLARGALTWGYAKRKVDRFSKGQMVEVHYDPGHPDRACLETGGMGWEDPLCLLLAFAGICFGMKSLSQFLVWLLRPRNLALVK